MDQNKVYVFDQLQSVVTLSADGASYFDFGDTAVGEQALRIGAPFENVPLVRNDLTSLPVPRLRAGFYPLAYGRGNGPAVPAAQLSSLRCSMPDGALIVHEVEYDSAGDLTRLAADYSVNCGHARVASNGAIRHRSAVALSLDELYVVPWRDHDVVEGKPIHIDGSLTWSPTSKVSTLTWRQISGPRFDLSACAAGVCKTYVPLVASGGAEAVFELSATAESGLSASGLLRLRIRSLQDRQTLIQLFGSPWDSVFTDRDGAFGLSTREGSLAIYPAQRPERFALGYAGSNINGIASPSLLGISLANTEGVPLQPGTTYTGTAVDTGLPAPYPAAGYSANAPTSCVHPSWTGVLSDLRRDPNDLTILQGLGYWFKIECPQGDAVYALFWLDYQPVSPPVARAEGPSTVARGTASRFVDAGSLAPEGGVALNSWQQVFGPAVASLQVFGDGSALVTPAPDTQDGAALVFAYQVFDGRGQPAVTLVRTTVQGGPVAAAVAGRERALGKSGPVAARASLAARSTAAVVALE